MFPSPGARYEPRAALVTGASSGIGAAFARALPATTDLMLVARNEERLEELAMVLAREGRRIEVVAADLAEREGRERAIAAAEAMRIDLLVNNAGLGSFAPFLSTEPGRIATALEVNVVAVTELARALLPGMIERAREAGRHAALLNLSSTTAFAPVPSLAVYAASKAYVLSLTESLAVELQREPVHVVAVCPGATRSEFGRRAGFRGGSLPGALDPDTVAKRALRAIGRKTVAFTDPPSELSLAGIARSRVMLARGLGFGIGMIRAVQNR